MFANWFPLALIAATTWGFVPFLEKNAVSVIDNGFTAVAIRSIGSSMGLLLVIFFPPVRTSLSNVPAKGYICLILAGFMASVFAQVAYLSAMKLGEVSRVAPVAAIWPVIAVIVAVTLLGESISLKKVIAVVLVMSGILLLKT